MQAGFRLVRRCTDGGRHSRSGTSLSIHLLGDDAVRSYGRSFGRVAAARRAAARIKVVKR
jgi:hypothetical protein